MNQKVVEPELSYKIVGIAFKIFKELGFGYQEKYYQRAFELEFKKEKIKYQKEGSIKLEYASQKIGNYRLDFIVENKIVVEIKAGEHFFRKDFSQIKNYLKRAGLKLGILILFSPGGIKFERILPTKT